jgi:methyl-accepting chemotaxis protein
MVDCGLDWRGKVTRLRPRRSCSRPLTPSNDPNASIRTTLRRRGVLATVASSPPRREEPVIDFFVLTSGTFGILATFLLVYLALRSVRDARDLRVIQGELTVLMRETKDLAEELHGLQCEIRTDQQAAKHDIDETKRTVEQVTEVVEQAADQVVEAAEQVAEVVVERRRPRLAWRRAARVPV